MQCVAILAAEAIDFFYDTVPGVFMGHIQRLFDVQALDYI
jgi:hypothetical protein